jgi:hypothetical protein
LIALSLMLLVTTFSLSMAARGALAVSAILGALVLLPMIPESMWGRYSTLLSKDAGDVSSNEAAESAAGRLQYFKESIQMTFQHPILGVGPGQFVTVSANNAKENNQRAAWRETHNSFSQVSSETGLVGFAFYLTAIIGSFRLLWRSRKWGPVRLFAEASLISGLGLLVTSNFSSAAYLYYWPVFCGLAIATYRVYVLGWQQQQMAAPSPTPAMSGAALPAPGGFPRGFAGPGPVSATVPTRTTLLDPGTRARPETPDDSPRNPLRLGRPRGNFGNSRQGQ